MTLNPKRNNNLIVDEFKYCQFQDMATRIIETYDLNFNETDGWYFQHKDKDNKLIPVKYVLGCNRYENPGLTYSQNVLDNFLITRPGVESWDEMRLLRKIIKTKLLKSDKLNNEVDVSKCF